MAIEKVGNGGVVVTGKDVNAFRMLSLKGMLKLESIGLKHSSGSVAKLIKTEFKLKASTRDKKALLAEYEELLRSKGILK